MFRSATTGKHIPAEGIPVIVIVRSDPSWSWRSLEDVMDPWAPGVRNQYQLRLRPNWAGNGIQNCLLVLLGRN